MTEQYDIMELEGDSMAEEDNKARRMNTVSTLMRSHHPAELMRSKIGDANGEEPEMDYHEGKGSRKNYEGFPKEYFTGILDFNAKINLVLEKKGLMIDELAREIKTPKTELLKYMKKNIIPNDFILLELERISGYPIEFFKAPPMVEVTRKDHRKKVIISIVLVSVVISLVIFAFIYFALL